MASCSGDTDGTGGATTATIATGWAGAYEATGGALDSGAGCENAGSAGTRGGCTGADVPIPAAVGETDCTCGALEGAGSAGGALTGAGADKGARCEDAGCEGMRAGCTDAGVLSQAMIGDVAACEGIGAGAGSAGSQTAIPKTPWFAAEGGSSVARQAMGAS